MIDLHTHTTASDGSLTPAALVEAATRVGLRAIAITDHDTLSGYEEARQVAEAGKVELLCGVELTTVYERAQAGGRAWSIHLLAYFGDGLPPPVFLDWLEYWRQARRRRNERLAQKLQQLGMEISLAEVEMLGGEQTGRPHFAELMVRKGYVRDREEAFRRYLDRGGLAYVPREKPTTVQAIQAVRSAGGVPVLAHPGRLSWDQEEEEISISQLVAQGLLGLEAWHPDHSPANARRYTAMAARFGLVVTGGSDFHGVYTPHVTLGATSAGARVPYEVVDRLRALIRR